MLNTTVVAPMPSASVSTATAVKPGFFSNWRRANLRSFMAQGFHGIEFGGFAGRQSRGEQSRSANNQHDGEMGQGIERRDVQVASRHAVGHQAQAEHEQ